MKTINCFTIAATRSGAGKTTLTIGILAALKRRNLSVQPFKCGPDFIDPTLHQSITNRTSYNLDLKMMGRMACRQTFYEHALTSDVSVLEGVMGLFDGGSASTASLAKLLNSPVVLIIDARSSAESCVAVLNGFHDYDPDVTIAGVIFNRIGSARHKQLIEDEVQRKSSVAVLGFMPRDINFEIPERHLGLHMGGENPLSHSALDSLADCIEKNLNLDHLLDMETVCCLPAIDSEFQLRKQAVARTHHSEKIDIAVASDGAFCFYYKQNFEILENAGFRLNRFSPLYDKKIPDHCRLVYLGGGYPELFAEKLASNREMLDNLRDMHERGVIIYAECGGFMYLCQELVDMTGTIHAMTGLFPFRTVMNKHLRKLGYRRAKLLQNTFLGKKGRVLHGHEFHYSHVIESEGQGSPEAIDRIYELDNNSHEGYHCGSAIGSYLHLHFGRNPEIAEFMYTHLSSHRI